MSPTDRDLAALASQVGEHLLAGGRVLATAESCTCGYIAKVVTDLAGSSAWFGYALVSYSNGAKQDLLDVPAATLVSHGAVSEATVRAMAEGALKRGGADVAAAVSGIAGPAGGTPDKPVGSVWLAWAVMGGNGPHTTARLAHFEGDRDAVRRQTVAAALAEVLKL